MDHDDDDWMRLAIAEARKGIGLTAPNPAVGAVIVKDGRLLGSGWHRRAGQSHAEREAIADAVAKHGEDACRGATVYVTLEPCSTTGRTPPCCDGLIDAGVARVIWGAMDPNPAHAGAAEAVMGTAGIVAEHGVLRDECLQLIRGFASAQTRDRPWVMAKTAMSLDGRIERPAGEDQWLSSGASREVVQQLRTEVDAIITSGATLRADDPSLTLRVDHPHGDKSPLWRVVFSRGGVLPPESKLFTDEFREFTLIVLVGTVEGSALHRAEHLVTKDNLIVVETLESGLRALAQRGIHQAMLEAGGRFLGQWLDHQLIDEFVAFYAPMICGGGALSVAGVGASSVDRLPRMVNRSMEVVGEDVMVRGEVDYSAAEAVSAMPLRPCVLFDRDGVVNDPKENYYVTRWSEFYFFPGIAEVIREVKLAGCLAVLVTSQRGVGKGEMTQSDLDEIHRQMQNELATDGAEFDAIYSYCGKEKDGPDAKPRPDMIFRAVDDHGADLHRSIIVGDADRDIEMGHNAGIPAIRLIGDKAVGVEADFTVDSIDGLAEVLKRWCASWK